MRVNSGELQGRLSGTAALFAGIPYAAPPVGPLRWREPQPVTPWKNLRDATTPGSSCVQNDHGLDGFIAPLAAVYGAPYAGLKVASSEDCLYLNVWVPNWPVKGQPRSSLPVMVWLHGGSNTAGSGSQSTYNGNSLVSHGVILVTVNYRLGVLGFFSHPELTKESGYGSSGNYGLLDQLAALRWVRENIAQFGGDPGNVTLFGESAGSIDAGVLMTSPLSSGLFRRVILESGPPFGLGTPHTLPETEAVGTATGRAAPGSAVSGLEKLRAMSATGVVKLAASVVQTQFKGFDSTSPIVDGWLLSQTPAKAFASGKIQPVDLLIGLNGRELSAFRIDAAAMTAKQPGQAKGSSGSPTDAVQGLANTMRPLYGRWTNPAIGVYMAKVLIHRAAARDAAMDQATNDLVMACPVGAIAALVNANGQKAFIYRFDRIIPGKGASELGAFHGLEVPFVFDAFSDNGWRWLPFTEADHRLSGMIESYWTNFAKTGDPNSAGLPRWSAWSGNDEPFMDFNESGNAAPAHDFSPMFCHLSADRLKEQLAGN